MAGIIYNLTKFTYIAGQFCPKVAFVYDYELRAESDELRAESRAIPSVLIAYRSELPVENRVDGNPANQDQKGHHC